MKAREFRSKFVIILSGLLLMSCLLPGMIPLTPVPTVPAPVIEKDADKVIEELNANKAVP